MYRFLIECFGLSLSVYFHQCSINIYSCIAEARSRDSSVSIVTRLWVRQQMNLGLIPEISKCSHFFPQMCRLAVCAGVVSRCNPPKRRLPRHQGHVLTPPVLFKVFSNFLRRQTPWNSMSVLHNKINYSWLVY